MTSVLDRLRDIRAAVAADPAHTLYQDLDDRAPVDADAWEILAIAQKVRRLVRGGLTQDERLAVLDLAISDVLRGEVRAVNDVEALTERKP